MHALKLIRQHSAEITDYARQTCCSKDGLLSWFLQKYDDQLDEHSLNNIGTIEKHLGEIIYTINHPKK